MFYKVASHYLFRKKKKLKFNELHLSAELLAEIDKAGFVEASPIQEQTIPLAMAGKDVIGQAQTGTGKQLRLVFLLWRRLIQRIQLFRH